MTTTAIADARTAFTEALRERLGPGLIGLEASLQTRIDAIVAEARALERRCCEAEREREIVANEKFFGLMDLTDEQFAEQCRARGHDPATFPGVTAADAEQSWKQMRVFIETACALRETRAELARLAGCAATNEQMVRWCQLADTARSTTAMLSEAQVHVIVETWPALVDAHRTVRAELAAALDANERWTARIRELEGRLSAIATIANGHGGPFA